MANQPEPNQPDPDDVIEIGADGELKSGKICSNCGTISKFKANYCRNCGASFADPSVRAEYNDPDFDPPMGLFRPGRGKEAALFWLPIIGFLLEAIFKMLANIIKVLGVIPSFIIGFGVFLLIFLTSNAPNSGYAPPTISYSQATPPKVPRNTSTQLSNTPAPKIIATETLPSETVVANTDEEF